jgi:nitrite reductase/ring-hydroxylating ferredoxin subunit
VRQYVLCGEKMNKLFACTLDSIKESHGKRVVVDGVEIALFKAEGKVYAITNVCPHNRFSLLHEGEFKDCVVTCPMHGWSFDVRTGNPVAGGGRVKKYETEVMNGKVFVVIDALI